MNIRKIFRSFSFAAKGFRKLLRYENNFQFHFIAAGITVCSSFWFSLSTSEWLAISIVIALVFSAEAFNTAVEKLADRITTEHDSQIADVKNISAAGVLIMAALAIIVACIIFIPKLLYFL